MRSGIEEVLRPALGHRDVRFVFPSEICAESWLALALERAWGPKALEADRFLGWDRFKEESVLADRREPVTDPFRRIFAARVLEENAEEGFFSAIIPREYAGEWQPFVGYVASKLPALGRLPGVLRAAGAEADPRAADWLELRRRYLEFLGRIGRAEPSFEPRVLGALPGRTVVFFPELIMDFAEYEAALAACPSVGLVRLPAQAPRVSLSRPETALAEIRDLLSAVGELMDRGVESADIAITVAGLDEYLPYLEREAALLSVPLAPRSGASLAATGGGRLFAALRDAGGSDFSYGALRDLLLSPAWPLADRRTAEALLAQGRRLHVVAPWTEGGTAVDAWERSLSGGLRSWYSELKRDVAAVVGAASFAELRKSYNVFKSEFLVADREAWDEGTDLSLARCVEELGELAAAEAAAGLGAGKASFRLFMRVLEDKVYVRAGADAGVRVSDWRVSAGIFPRYHFVLGATQDALSVPNRSFDFLGEELRKRVGSALYADPAEADRDSGPDFITAYALSGSEVRFSCPSVGWGGETAVHGFLLSLPGADEGAEPFARDSSYPDETAWLSGRAPAPEKLHRVQVEGILAAAETGEVADAGELALAGSTAARAADTLRRKRREGGTEEFRSIDSTAIDYYLDCPFKYLYLRLLDAGSESSGIDFVDAFFLGDVYHEALALLFAKIRSEDGCFKPERLEVYRGYAPECLRAAFDRLAKERGPFAAVVLEAYRSRLEGYLGLLLEAEAESFPNLEVVDVEGELELPYPELAGGFVLRGRIDRISRSEAGAVVVDYKKGKVPERSRVAPDAGGGIAEAQIPCYLKLVSSRGDRVDSAWYYSLEGYGSVGAARPVCAFGDAGERGRGAYVPREGLEAFLAAFESALRDTAIGISAGRYPTASKESQKTVCQGCDARGICRERYSLRFRPAGSGARVSPGRAAGPDGRGGR